MQKEVPIASASACPACVDTGKVSVPPAVKLSAATHAQPALDPDITAAEVVEDLQAALAQFAEIASDLKMLTQKGAAVELDWFNQSSHYGSVLTFETKTNPEKTAPAQSQKDECMGTRGSALTFDTTAEKRP